ncbi:MAG: zinc-binding dehydrogenase [Gammaproteobacteria bacterium]
MIEQHNLLNRVAGLVDAGTIKTTINKVLKPINATNLKAAHAEIEGRHAIGKIVLQGW